MHSFPQKENVSFFNYSMIDLGLGTWCTVVEFKDSKIKEEMK